MKTPPNVTSRENSYEKTSILEDITHYEKRIKSLMRKRAAVPPDADSTNS